jgi:hypothetical protein
MPPQCNGKILGAGACAWRAGGLRGLRTLGLAQPVKVKKSRQKPSRVRPGHELPVQGHNQDGKLRLAEYQHKIHDRTKGRRRFATFDKDKDGAPGADECSTTGKPCKERSRA